MASLNLDKSKDIAGEGQQKAECEPQSLTKESEDAAPSSGKEPKQPSAEQLETHVSCALMDTFYQHIYVCLTANCLILSLSLVSFW